MITTEYHDYKKAWQVTTEMPVSFMVKYSSDVFNPINHDLISFVSSDRQFVVIDKTVHDLYGVELNTYFKTLKIQLNLIIIDATEATKDWDHTNQILQFFDKFGLNRREPTLAIGGGVLLDMVGFACSIYRRGVPYVKVPTTLLALIDASVGAKTGANHFERRNRIGTYYPPIAALLDKKFINTQDERNIVNGIGEIFKMALIKDKELFEILEQNANTLITERFQKGAIPVRVINRAIQGMIEELAPNLWEKKLDRCVDFGHSFSPMIEMKNIPNLFHGEAVTLDCLLSSCLSCWRNYITEKDLDRIFNVAQALKLPTWHNDFTNVELLNDGLADTMKHRNHNQYLPVPVSIGNYRIINDVTLGEIKDAVGLFKVMNGK